MFVVTPDEMKTIDNRAIKDFKIPGIVLMENAAIGVYQVIKREYYLLGNEKILVVCGTGNNGGDGFAVARHLFLNGFDVTTIFLNPKNAEPRGDALINYNILREVGAPVINVIEDQQVEDNKHLFASDYIIDAIFGTGLKAEVGGIYRRAIDRINASKATVVAVDIPSGIEGATGRIMEAAVKASATVTFGYPKRGHLLYPGREYAGSLHVVPISLPADSAKAVGVKAFTLDDEEVASMLKDRPSNGHKGTFGHVAVMAGSTGLTGAACLTSLGALRAGAGLVTLGVPASLNPIFENKLTEVMTLPLYDEGTGYFHPDCMDQVYEFLKGKDVLALGPGISKNSGIFKIIRNIISDIDISIVLDADALNNISKDIDILKSRKGPTVITPHPGEMSRLTGLEVSNILKDPVAVASDFARRFNVIVLLKGAASVAADPGGRIYINRTGNSGMGTGGTGDVLTGIIASLIAQGYHPFNATVLGSYIHGRTGDFVAKELGKVSLIAGDLIDFVPQTFNFLYKLKESLESD